MTGLHGKTILITGGAGFLGRGILRRAFAENWGSQFTIYSRDEQKQDACRKRYPDCEYVLGDIRDVERLQLVMRRHDVVIHAAALKYVPEAEQNVSECIGVNIDGTKAVLGAAYAAGVETVVLISTDKAVEPQNMYGLSKAVAERLVYEASEWMPDRKIVACRYGNVIGSTGSVVPLFKYQQQTAGCITITDPTMTRFWIDIDEAIDLIDFSANLQLAYSGCVVIPTPKSLEIGKVAEAICGAGVRVQRVGERPGERHHERLMTQVESLRTVRIPSEGMYLYHPHHELNNDPVELRSDTADRIPVEEFAAVAKDAELV